LCNKWVNLNKHLLWKSKVQPGKEWKQDGTETVAKATSKLGGETCVRPMVWEEMETGGESL
jgi:hypothetical protein